MLHYYKHQFVPCDRTLELYFTGCCIRCKGCQNEILWEDAGKNKTPNDIIAELEDYIPITKCVHILGGEPLIQNKDMMSELLDKLHKIGFKTIILFTGFDTLHDKNLWKEYPQIFHADYLKVGSYKDDMPNTDNIKDEYGLNIILATKNQKIYKVKE